MAKKRKPRPRRPAPEPATAVRERSETAPTKPPPKPPADVYPGLWTTLGRAFLGVSSSWVTVLAPFALVALLWMGLLAFGLQVFPPTIATFLAIPPFSALFNFSTSAALFGLTGGAVFFFLAAITIVQALVLAIFTGLLDEALEYGSVSRLGLLRGLNGFWGVLLFCYVASGLVLVGNILLPAVLGPQLGYMIYQILLVATLFLFGFAPAASVRLGVPATEALARAMKGARLPGWPRQLILAGLYFFIAYLVLLVLYPGLPITANPTFLDWCYVLFSVFLHMVFLAAFIERWKIIEPYVPRQLRPRGRPARPSGSRASR